MPFEVNFIKNKCDLCGFVIPLEERHYVFGVNKMYCGPSTLRENVNKTSDCFLKTKIISGEVQIQ